MAPLMPTGASCWSGATTPGSSRFVKISTAAPSTLTCASPSSKTAPGNPTPPLPLERVIGLDGYAEETYRRADVPARGA